MVLVNVRKLWPAVLGGCRTAAEVTLGDWAQMTDEDVERYGDVILGIFRNEVVSAFDVTGWKRRPDRRVTFQGVPSKSWAHLIGTPNPGKRWVPGQARPVQYLATTALTHGTASVGDTPVGGRAIG